MALLQKAYLGATSLFREIAWFETLRVSNVEKGPSDNSNTVTASSTAHTKGAWTQLVASSSFNASSLFVAVHSVATNATNTATLLDIGFGTSGSEQAVVENVGVGGAFTGSFAAGNFITYEVPLQIPSGTRISARIQSVVSGGKTALVACYLINRGDYALAPTSVDVLGSNITNSQAASLSGSSGTFAEIVASTTRNYRAIAVIPSIHSNDVANLPAVFNVAVGASGNEEEFGQVETRIQNQEYTHIMPPYTTLFGRNIPAGSRLSVKHNIAANPDRCGVTLIGIP
jgi:hypothetical protein